MGGILWAFTSSAKVDGTFELRRSSLNWPVKGSSQQSQDSAEHKAGEMQSQEDRLGDGKRASIYGVPTAAEVTARREVAGGWPGVEVWIPLTHQTESVAVEFGEYRVCAICSP